jgi:hypothetical protein
MAGISYLPTTTGSNYTTTGGIPMGLQHEVTVAADNSTSTLLNAFEKTLMNGTGPSGINIGLTGIGALHLLTQAQNLQNGFVEPQAITTIRSTALGLLNVLAVSITIHGTFISVCLSDCFIGRRRQGSQQSRDWFFVSLHRNEQHLEVASESFSYDPW